MREIKQRTKAEKKAFVREQMAAKWFDLTEEDRKIRSKYALINLSRYLNDIRAKKVLFYASMEDEPSTDEILDEWIKDSKRTLVLTRACNRTKQLDPYVVTSWDDLEMGRFRIRMPKTTCQQIDLMDLDAIIIPGRAFDMGRNRLGRGYGFYDRFLSIIPRKVKRIGFAFDFQVLKSLPVEDHDMPMDVLITTKSII